MFPSTSHSLKCYMDEMQMLPTEKEVNLERALGNLNENLASVLCELNAKDELLAQHAKMAEEANTGNLLFSFFL